MKTSKKKRLLRVITGCLAVSLLFTSCGNNNSVEPESTETVISETEPTMTIPEVEITESEITTEATTIETEPVQPENQIASGNHDLAVTDIQDIIDTIDKKTKAYSEKTFEYNNISILPCLYNCRWETELEMPNSPNLKYAFVYKTIENINTDDLPMISIDPGKSYTVNNLYDRWAMENENNNAVNINKENQLYYWLVIDSDDWFSSYCIPMTIIKSEKSAPIPVFDNNMIKFDSDVQIITSDMNKINNNDFIDLWKANKNLAPLAYNNIFGDNFGNSVILKANTPYEFDINDLKRDDRILIYRGIDENNNYTAWKALDCNNMPASVSSIDFDPDSVNILRAASPEDMLTRLPLSANITYSDNDVYNRILEYNFNCDETGKLVFELDEETNTISIKYNVNNILEGILDFNPEWEEETCAEAVNKLLDRQAVHAKNISDSLVNIAFAGVDADIIDHKDKIVINDLISTPEFNAEELLLFANWKPGHVFRLADTFGIVNINADDICELLITLQLYDLNDQIIIPVSHYNDQNISDMIYKIMTQNPWCAYISSIDSMGYNQNNNIVININYAMDKAKIRSQRADIYTAASGLVDNINKIISESGSENNSDKAREACHAIIDSAKISNNNLVYSLDLSHATDNAKSDYSAYNILCNKSGTDYGYAQAYKILCDMLDIESKIITGYENGKLHTWNKVYINDNWYVVDITNNIISVDLLPHSYCLTSDSLAAELIPDNIYNNFAATDNSLDEWFGQGKIIDLTDLPDNFKNNYDPANIYAVKIRDIEKYSDTEIENILSEFEKTAVISGNSDDDHDYRLLDNIFVFGEKSKIF